MWPTQQDYITHAHTRPPPPLDSGTHAAGQWSPRPPPTSALPMIAAMRRTSRRSSWPVRGDANGDAPSAGPRMACTHVTKVHCGFYPAGAFIAAGEFACCAFVAAAAGSSRAHPRIFMKTAASPFLLSTPPHQPSPLRAHCTGIRSHHTTRIILNRQPPQVAHTKVPRGTTTRGTQIKSHTTRSHLHTLPPAHVAPHAPARTAATQ